MGNRARRAERGTDRHANFSLLRFRLFRPRGVGVLRVRAMHASYQRAIPVKQSETGWRLVVNMTILTYSNQISFR